MHVYHQYTVRVPEDRDGLAAALREEYAVGSGMFYPIPTIGWRRSRATSTCPRPSTPRASACPCRSTRRSPQGDLERIVDAVNTLAKAGA